MLTRAFWFELGSALLLVGCGAVLVATQLPGWGLVGAGGLIAGLSALSYRQRSAVVGEVVSLSVKCR
ncbi:hypothetical protein [Marinobacterium arenosum]|uniref:hypothetical protein n=1 Tax=Marinobacterium arenosum TaxID=2862496 RepID=UPI001C966CC8|nr:hypothetical protein [Marinobacterium arenosum]MBY4678116.1 hypothetical protein [Marinobacterium arenosum]